MEEIKTLAEEVFKWYELSDPRSKGDHPNCLKKNDEFEEKAKSISDKELKTFFSSLDQEHLDALYPAISNMIDDRPYLEKYMY